MGGLIEIFVIFFGYLIMKYSETKFYIYYSALWDRVKYQMSFIMNEDSTKFKRNFQESLMLKKVFQRNFWQIYLEFITGIDFGKITKVFCRKDDKTILDYFSQERQSLQYEACFPSLYLKTMSL